MVEQIREYVRSKDLDIFCIGLELMKSTDVNSIDRYAFITKDARLTASIDKYKVYMIDFYHGNKLFLYNLLTGDYIL